MTSDRDAAANKFLERLQKSTPFRQEDQPVQPAQHIIINRPVRCTFVIGNRPKKRAAPDGASHEGEGA